MILLHLFQELRVFGAIALLYAAASWFVASKTHRAGAWAVWSLRVALFAETLCLVLGHWRLCLPGITIPACLLFLAVARLSEGDYHPISWRRAVGSILSTAPWNLQVSPAAFAFEVWQRIRHALARLPYRGVWCAAAAFLCFYPLQHVRFLSSDSYSRVVSLGTLTMGQPASPDGSVALLAPIAFLAGEDPAAVIRDTNPILMLGLALVAAFAIWEMTGSRWGTLTVGTCVLGVELFSRGGAELSRGGISAIAWLIAVVLLNRSSWDAAGAIALALMAEPAFRIETVLYVGGTLGAMLILWMGRSVAQRLEVVWGIAAAAPVIFLVLLGDPGPPPAYQYESAAAAAETISRTFPQRHWLIVSPVQEVAFTYGRGWHYEISDFVNKYRAEQVSRPDFKFDFPVNTLFVFVEKRPLGSASPEDRALFTPEFDPSMLPYERFLDRASLEFAAGSVVSAYRTSHQGVDVFFEDEAIRVYKIEL